MAIRLPKNYIPLHYDLYIHYSTMIYIFDASVTITFQKNQESDKLYLNVLQNIRIEKITQNNISLKYELNYPDLVIFRSTEPDQDFSTYPITIKYTVQPLQNVYKGFYTYKNSFLTSFEPNEASSLLPCFDDPSVRSSFHVKIRIPSNLCGLSNMPAETITTIEDEKEISFLPTPPMCCYLLSIFVGPFNKSVKGQTKNGHPLVIYAENIDEETIALYLNMALFSVQWFEDKMGVQYELPHLQFLSYEGIGLGMENYGLIALYDFEKTNLIANSLVIMHEIAHLWFGDLVSIKWWDSIWLNEGFAQYFEYLVLKDSLGQTSDFSIELFIKYDGIRCLNFFEDEKIVCKESEVDFQKKALRSVHYIKGAFVLKMFSDIIGEVNFFKICSNYLQTYKNKSVEVSDFLGIVNKTMNNDYSDYFDVWLNEVGLPLLNVVELYNDKNDIIGITISQASFSDKIYQFKLPITYEKNGEIKKMVVMMDKSEIEIDADFDWILVNDNVSSLCAVIYSKVLMEKLVGVKSKINKINSELIYISPKVIANQFTVDEDVYTLCQEFSNEETIYFSSSTYEAASQDNSSINNESFHSDIIASIE